MLTTERTCGVRSSIVDPYSSSDTSSTIVRPSPVIRRDGIWWTGGAGDAPLRLELDFENPGDTPSRPRTAVVQIAAFGAFLPWKDLTRVRVPAIPPGGRRVVTATAGDDEERRAVTAAAGPGRSLAELFLSASLVGLRGLRDFRQEDVQAFLDGGGGAKALRNFVARMPHFVGNLNVFVSRRAPVERHVQRAVGLVPGRTNFAMFCVGDGRVDRYRFSLDAPPGWEASLAGVRWETWVDLRMAHLSIVPPAGADSGRLAVWVERESTRERVPVEFELDVRPGGAKCYFF